MIEKAWTWAATDGRFWLILIGAAVIKALFSERLGIRGVLASFGMAIFSGLVLTDPIMHITGLDVAIRDLVLLGVALTGESLMRAAIVTFNDPEFFKKIVQRRLGGSDK